MRLLTPPGVFHPRSDSRLLAATVAEATSPGGRVLDLCTGSGIVAVSAALADAGEVTAVDLSRRAVVTAWLNARRNGVTVRARRGDLFAAVAGQRFDLIATNPPYLPGPEVPTRGAARAWEGGPDGRRFLDRIIDGASGHLAPGGVLLLLHSSVCGVETTLARMDAAGLRGDVVVRERGPLGPLLGARAGVLEERGLLAPGEREEDVVIIRAAAKEEARL
jgi:release factor glutamine methyltransferase